MKNTNVKKVLAAVVLSCAALSSVSLQAAESQSYTIDLRATIPSDDFHILPTESGWIGQTQEMAYDTATKRLQPFEKEFQFKNTAGGIQATLTNFNSDGKAVLSNGSDVIPLAVTFNGVTLSKTAQTVVAAAAAKDGGRTALRITQDSATALTATGSFTGQVAMIFEPAVVTPES